MNYKHVIGLLVLLMFGGCAYEFGGNWNQTEWALFVVSFLIFALALVAPKLAMGLIKALPGIIEKGKTFLSFKKKEDPPSDGKS